MSTFDPKVDLEKIMEMFPGCTSIDFANHSRSWEVKYRCEFIRLEPITLKVIQEPPERK